MVADFSPQKIQEEFRKCKTDPVYFISNYVYVIHPMRGLVKFNLYPFQKMIINEWRNNRFNILRKFRQAGCTTLVSAYSLWMCTFRNATTIAILSKGDIESTEIVDRIRLMHDELPSWLKAKKTMDNQHTLKFENKSVIKSRASGPNSGRSISGNLVIFDEAAFIENMDKIYTASYPIISTGGSIIALSTVNGVGNWFHKIYMQALKGENAFNPIDINWTSHPEYKRHQGYEELYESMAQRTPPMDIDMWEKITRANLSHKEWLQEYECSFLGTGDTYIDGGILSQLKENCNKDFYSKYSNRMRVWKDPLPYHDYAIGVDGSIGRGQDYSAFQVIDIYNGEQVGEFYSNVTPLNEFAKIIADEGRLYNIAYIMPERNNIGQPLLDNLFEYQEYENIISDDNGEMGLMVTQKNREQLLSDMEEAIRTGRIKLNSERTVDELLTFIINPDTHKIEADEKCHDDLIMSLAITVNIFKNIRATTPIYQDKLIDPMDKWKPPIHKTKYLMKTAYGGMIEEEYLKWMNKRS